MKTNINKINHPTSNGMKKDAFKERALAIVRKIPKGKVLSYGQVANAAGYPRAARAVGTLMSHNHDKTVPCHRVVRSDGRIGEYNGGGTSAKIARLRSEGVSINGAKVASTHLMQATN